MYREYFRFGFKINVLSSLSAPDLLGFFTAPWNGCCWGDQKSLKLNSSVFCCCCCKIFKYILIFKTAEIGNILKLTCGRVEKVLPDCFDIISIVGQHRIVLVTKKPNLLCANIPRFHLLILDFFSFIFCFYLAATSHPYLALSLKHVQPEFPVPGWILRDPSPAQLCICVLQCRNPSHTRQSLFCQPKDVSSLVPQKPHECSFDPLKISLTVNLLQCIQSAKGYVLGYGTFAVEVGVCTQLHFNFLITPRCISVTQYFHKSS